MTQSVTFDTKTCPRCGGTVEFKAGTVLSTCKYCGISCIRTGEEYQEHYMMNLQYDTQRIKQIVIEQAMKQLGAPSDVQENISIQSAELAYWPFWIVKLKSNAKYTGTQKKPDFGKKVRASNYTMKYFTVEEEGSFDETNFVLIPATTMMPKILRTYHIPIARKQFYDWEYIIDRKGTIIDVETTPEEAEVSARKQVEDQFKREAKWEVSKFLIWEYIDELTGLFLLHTPIWKIKYKYRTRRYTAIIDGASGRVLSLNFPRMLKYRTEVLAISVFHGIIAAFCWYLMLTLLNMGGAALILVQAVAGLAVGFSIFALYILRKALSISSYKQEL